MSYCEKKGIVSALMERLKTLPAGTATCTSELFRSVFPGKEQPEFRDFFDINEALFEQSEKNGLYLDNSKHFFAVEGLPFNLDFVIKPLKRRITFDRIECTDYRFLRQGHLVIDLHKKTFDYQPLGCSECVEPISRHCTANEWEQIADYISMCRFDQWEKEYDDMSIIDGEQWEIVLKKKQRVVRRLEGSNAYPDCWHVFEYLWRYINCLATREAKVMVEPSQCPFCGKNNIGDVSTETMGEKTDALNARTALPCWVCRDCGMEFYQCDDSEDEDIPF